MFVHFSAIEGDGYRNLNKGQRVEFSIEDTDKGPQAIQVVGLAGEAVSLPDEAPSGDGVE